MEVRYEDKTITTPDLTAQEMNVHVDTANELIGGTSLTAEDIKELLEKAMKKLNFSFFSQYTSAFGSPWKSLQELPKYGERLRRFPKKAINEVKFCCRW